jgi:hypothetical protein
MFPSSGGEKKAPTLLGLLKRGHLNRWCIGQSRMIQEGGQSPELGNSEQ